MCQVKHENHDMQAACPEPHHRAIFKTDVAHKLHHWKERATCLGLCTALHFILEWTSHFW